MLLYVKNLIMEVAQTFSAASLGNQSWVLLVLYYQEHIKLNENNQKDHHVNINTEEFDLNN